MDIALIYEDKDVLAFNKPSGLLVHPDGKSGKMSLSEWLPSAFPETKGVGGVVDLASGGKTERNGIVHRLDKETSGLIVVARNQNAFEFLQKQFTDRTVSKTYHAFVYGQMGEEQGTISFPIGRSRSDFRQWNAEGDTRGQIRPAETEYKTLIAKKEFSFVEVKPKTGRTHQIRVHFKAIGHPVVSDALYAPKKAKGLGLNRLGLHAYMIDFVLPIGRKVTLKAPYPEDFSSALEKLALGGRS
ncbi:MAG: ribosomal large subunit pseudouridine synthase rRNA synthase [Candidatus Parcubacteria bacterium]|jgi:23S rRNA pseudouridine1911/1915/1917 synthase